VNDDKYPLVDQVWAGRWLELTEGEVPRPDGGAHGATHKVVPVDAIVIEVADLPPVTHDPRTGRLGVDTMWAAPTEDPEMYVQAALRRIALARCLREHSAVDEDQVAAVAAVLGDFSIFDTDGTRNDLILARSLVKRGVRVEVAE
jgi:hypothetical protein